MSNINVIIFFVGTMDYLFVWPFKKKNKFLPFSDLNTKGQNIYQITTIKWIIILLFA